VVVFVKPALFCVAVAWVKAFNDAVARAEVHYNSGEAEAESVTNFPPGLTTRSFFPVQRLVVSKLVVLSSPNGAFMPKLWAQ
jgi:hypothetical protein